MRSRQRDLLPMAGIAAAIRAGRLSFAFLEAAPYRRWAVRSALTYRQVSPAAGLPPDRLASLRVVPAGAQVQVGLPAPSSSSSTSRSQ